MFQALIQFTIVCKLPQLLLIHPMSNFISMFFRICILLHTDCLNKTQVSTMLSPAINVYIFGSAAGGMCPRHALPRSFFGVCI